VLRFIISWLTVLYDVK